MNDERYFIEEIKCGETEGGVACGPCPGATIVSVRYRKDGESKWLHLTVFDGFTIFMETEKDLFDGLIDDGYVDKNIDMLNSITVSEINGINVSDGFSTIFDYIEEDPDNSVTPLMKMYRALYEYDDKERESFYKIAVGRFIDEIEIPKTRLEIRREKWGTDY